MAHWKSYTDREFLYAFDLRGRDVDVQIERVEGAVVVAVGGKKSKKPKIFFRGHEKPLIANATNCKSITSIVGDPDVEKWLGAWITLFPTTCAALTGEMVECIRVRPKAPVARDRDRGKVRSAPAPSDAAASDPTNGRDPSQD